MSIISKATAIINMTVCLLKSDGFFSTTLTNMDGLKLGKYKFDFG